MAVATLATCNLNQWALDFDGNLERITRSIQAAKEKGARYRLGPELEITGYGCEDHFLEQDTFRHSWQSLKDILSSTLTNDIVCDIGMPVLHKNVRYNCRVFCLDQKILLIRPKLFMADDGNYRETRWFTPWDEQMRELQEHTLPPSIQEVTGQAVVPFGVAALVFPDGTIAAETCEELFTPRSPHIGLGLDGVEIIGNGSGSHHQLRKLQTRLDLIRSATAKSGGAYLYANQKGCDGGRLYYDGCALVAVNGSVVAQGSQFSVADVEVVLARVDLEDIRSYRGAISSRSRQAATSRPFPHIRVAFNLTQPFSRGAAPSAPIPPRMHSPQEEIAFGPACWLWDHLRRSGASGYFLPLSGGADSSAVAAIVGVMTHLVCAAAQRGDTQVLSDVRRILGLPPTTTFAISLTDGGDDTAAAATAPADAAVPTSDVLLTPSPPPTASAHPTNGETKGSAGDGDGGSSGAEPSKAAAAAAAAVPLSPRSLAQGILHSCYLGTRNSSEATRSRAAALAAEVGAYHSCLNIDRIVEAVTLTFEELSGARPRFSAHGGSAVEDVALQNIQARLRMVLSYMLGQLLPWTRQRTGAFLLVLGTANVDEGLRGYLTKYDCSSADLNPIGAISKTDLKAFLPWAARAYGYPSLLDIVAAPPTAELRPNLSTPDAAATAADGESAGAGAAGAEHSQTDEEDMGMSYEELGQFGRLRKLSRCGPVSMWQKLLHTWPHLTPREVADKVKRFFRFYSMNRHKMTVITPSYHAEQYSPDDNRFDLRQFLYNTRWSRQFRDIDALVARMESNEQAVAAAAAAAAGAVAQVASSKL